MLKVYCAQQDEWQLKAGVLITAWRTALGSRIVSAAEDQWIGLPAPSNS